jgi:TatA/E family protein of Tat protein translocase
MNILGMGPMELILIVVLALIVFGPAKLPEIMGQVGKAIGDFRRATSDLSDEFNRTIQAELQEGRSVLSETKAAVSEVHTTVNSAVSLAPAPTRVATPDDMPSATNGAAVEVGANGISAEAHLEGAANGTLPAASKPPLADTAQWSWETAAPTPAVASGESDSDPTGTDPLKPDATTPEPHPAPEPHTTAEPPKPAEKPKTDSPATPPRERDELLPPY